ncbi:hypothetical protein [Hymenobacter canadensis]|uniref:Uncharacterized protein n=1 Tax=Hymenobacter canadensis TaxID=2999067 RepID=A0ABY7LV94_9BACT|nr:hypothetical protein [Hymenobacter canadensis]WBA43165.1 hypothetical protein O3303_06270 [Hymenobacter canadensis]
METKERGFGTMVIGGRERGFHIGTFQSKVFCDHRGIKPSDYLEELGKFALVNSVENNIFVCDLLYSALVAYGTFKREQIDFTADDVMFWADMAETEELAKLFTVMGEMRRNTPKK